MTEEEARRRLRELLTHARAKRRLAMAALARRAGLGRTTVSQALNGRHVPSEATLVALAGALDLDPDELLRLRRASLGATRAAHTEGLSPQDIGFEERYLAYLKRRHSSLTVVGLDLRGPAQASWPLDAAYLSLELAERDLGWGYPAGRAGAQQRVERAEVALSGSRRTLIRGLAGSGKTTLLQWLACATATAQLPAPLEELRSSVAFVLPLRTLARRGELPEPTAYLEAVGCPFAAAQPEGWIDRVLGAGRGLLLVDGLDEVPKAMRERTGHWLRDLAAAYGRSRLVVTTRPNAVPDFWLSDLQFRELTVRPMSRGDVGVFVSRWHAAAKREAPDKDVRAHLDVLEAELRDKVRAKRDLALLTTTPLLCALVCALHRDRRGRLPHDRMELYAAALSMLLIRRDQEREVNAPEGVELSERESIQLLQKLAYWLIRNGQTELSRTTAEFLIDEALPLMPSVAEQGDAAAILAHLLGRTGLLRAPTADTVHFVHRTFQDYLGAKAAVETKDLPLLVNNAHDDQWEDVIRMAVAHARPDERADLLGRLTERAAVNGQSSTRLTLLALACLQHATELSASVRAEIQARADDHLPPRTDAEADALAQVGPVVLDLLPPPERLADDEVPATIRTAQRLGGDPALTYLKAFTRLPAADVGPWLAQDWSGFDPQTYVSEVLTPVAAAADVMVQVDDGRQAAALRPLPVTKAHFRGAHAHADLAGFPHAPGVTTLVVGGGAAVTGLAWLRPYAALEDLTLYGLSGLTTLHGLRVGHLTGRLTALRLRALHPNLDLSALNWLTGLRTLSLHTELAPYLDLVGLLRGHDLRSLTLGHEVISDEPLKALSSWPGLVHLGLPAWQFTTYATEVSGLPRLTRVELSQVDLTDRDLHDMPPLPRIRDAVLTQATGDDLTAVARLFPYAHTLTLTAATPTQSLDLTPLTALPALERLDVIGFHGTTGTDAFRAGVVRARPRRRVGKGVGVREGEARAV
ncbi:NACHT domain-containing protein [Streptomyces sp. G45]|uniref:NACHT domain-containing protein n=1 Tax=Streptomyces sp. G45 TaxID=3406627 RepID=UPI003C22EBCE